MITITNKNIREFAEAFNENVKELVYTNGEIIKFGIDDNDNNTFYIFPDSKTCDIEASCIFLPDEFNLSFESLSGVESLNELRTHFLDSDNYVLLTWKNDNLEAYLEIAPHYVDFGYSKSSITSNFPVSIFDVQLLQ